MTKVSDFPALYANKSKTLMTVTLGDEKAGAIDLRQFKEQLRNKLPSSSPVLADLLNEPDLMPVARAEVLVPHYIQRLERELADDQTSRPMVLRS